VALFDDVGAGHRPAFMAGLTEALTTGGHRVTGIGSADDDGGHRPPGVASWHSVPLTSVTALRRGRSMLAGAVEICRREGVTVWFDLDLNRNILRVDRRLLAIPYRIHIVHRVDRPFELYRSLLGRFRTSYSRRRLRWLASHDSRFMVHTDRAYEYLAGVVGKGYVIRSPLPVVGAPPDLSAPGRKEERDALFVGRVRPDRGFSTLLEAFEKLENPPLLRVVGRQDPGFQDAVARDHPTLQIHWENRYVSRAELHTAYRSAAFVVLPYDSTFVDSGSSSMVLLEAMAHGVPIVSTPALFSLLPLEFGGAMIADDYGGDAYAAALRATLDNLPELTLSAADEGPRAIRKQHSFSDYAGALLEGALSAGPKGRPRPA
jgi:glycosyltransferase involved in cell wall biosynthesis